MARLPRYFIPNQPQHIIQRGNNGEAIFISEEDYQFYLSCLLDASREHGLEIHAYVLMENHLHLLASPHFESSLPKTFQSIGRRYVQYFNKKYQRTGTLWEGRYKATVIDADQYLLKCCRYIESKPLRNHLVRRCIDYPWSSYHHNANGKKDDLISEHRIYKGLGANVESRCAYYKPLFKQKVSIKFEQALQDATDKGWALGSEAFLLRVEILNDRRSRPRKRGRHKKVTV